VCPNCGITRHQAEAIIERVFASQEPNNVPTVDATQWSTVRNALELIMIGNAIGILCALFLLIAFVFLPRDMAVRSPGAGHEHYFLSYCILNLTLAMALLLSLIGKLMCLAVPSASGLTWRAVTVLLCLLGSVVVPFIICLVLDPFSNVRILNARLSPELLMILPLIVGCGMVLAASINSVFFFRGIALFFRNEHLARRWFNFLILLLALSGATATMVIVLFSLQMEPPFFTWVVIGGSLVLFWLVLTFVHLRLLRDLRDTILRHLYSDQGPVTSEYIQEL
jgi:hypothetical protein